MEIGEPIGVFMPHLNKDDFCEDKTTPANTNWQSRINKVGSKGGQCSGTNLYESMEKYAKQKLGYLGPPTAFVKKTKGISWDLYSIKKDQFPIQAHHLIPKNHLPDHPVCAFLAKKYKDDKYELTADTQYSCDHSNNGYCMPYATPTADWRKAGGNDDLKKVICFEVMDLTGRQLHQGSHRGAPPEVDPPVPDEQNAIHDDDYLNKVTFYLNAVYHAAKKHADACRVCKKDKKKKEVQPINATVRHVDQVSGIIKLLIDANWIFVSEVAELWWSEKRSPKLTKPKWIK